MINELEISKHKVEGYRVDNERLVKKSEINTGFLNEVRADLYSLQEKSAEQLKQLEVWKSEATELTVKLNDWKNQLSEVTQALTRLNHNSVN